MEEIKSILKSNIINIIIFAVILLLIIIFNINPYWNVVILPFLFLIAITTYMYNENKK